MIQQHKTDVAIASIAASVFADLTKHAIYRPFPLLVLLFF